MSYEFRPATRTKTSVIIGLAGASGSGKTLSALKLANGLAGPDGRIAFIDTERGRGLHYAPPPGVPADPTQGTYAFEYVELVPPFSPRRYQEIIAAADEADYDVIIADSFSHEWEGEGGVCDMRDEAFQKLGAREAVSILSWKEPKNEHKKMVGRLLQCRAHLIICLRAQEKLKLVKNAQGKQEVIAASERPVAERWEPICEKNLPYEFTVSFVLTPGDPGIPVPVKLQNQHRPFFPLDQQLDEIAGTKLAAWAAGKPDRLGPPPPLTRGEVRALQDLIEAAEKRGRIEPSEREMLRQAIEEKNAQLVRDGIRSLAAKVAA